MPRVRFTLPQVKARPDSRPSECPRGGGILNRHGSVFRTVEDTLIREVEIHRYRCTECRRTFRHYPEGVDNHGQSQRLRAAVTLLWALGLSLRSTSHALRAPGCEVSRMSVWRDIQEAGTNAPRGWLGCARGRVRLIGADETFVKVEGKRVTVGFVTDDASS